MSVELASRPVVMALPANDDPVRAEGQVAQAALGSVAQLPISALQVIGHSGLFDGDFYLRGNPDLAGLGSEALSHYHHSGWREGRKPNGIM